MKAVQFTRRSMLTSLTSATLLAGLSKSAIAAPGAFAFSVLDSLAYNSSARPISPSTLSA